MKTIETKEPSADGIRAHKLMCAVMKNDLEAFKNLFTHGTQVILIPSPESLKILNEREHTNIPEDRCALTLAIQIGRLEVVDYVMQNIQINTKFQEYIFRYAIQHHQLGVVKLLLEKYGIRYKSAIAEAVTYDCGHHYEDKDITLYLLEHNDDGFFDLYCDKEYNSYKREYVYIPPTSILRMAVCNASCRYPGQGWHVVVDAIATRYPQLLHETQGGAWQHSGQPLPQICLYHFDISTLKVLKKHLGYIDVNQKLPGYYRDVSTPLYEAAYDAKAGKDGIGYNHEHVKFLAAYGADVGARDEDAVDLPKWDRLQFIKAGNISQFLQFLKEEDMKAYGVYVKVRDGGAWGPLTVREWMLQDVKDGRMEWYKLDAYDRGVREGKEIWEWNQWVMREVVKWCGCVMRGGGGDGVGTLPSMGSVVGIGKRAVEAVVKFAPAQFEEKLEMGTVQLLRAQAMLEMGHGVAFGDMHHGGYVKYVGGTTVTCDYHIDVRILDYVKNANVAKIVHVGGDSYVDRGIIAANIPGVELRAHDKQGQCLHVWGGDAYNQKLQAQQQWYLATGEFLPTLAGVIHEDTQHAQPQLQHVTERNTTDAHTDIIEMLMQQGLEHTLHPVVVDGARHNDEHDGVAQLQHTAQHAQIQHFQQDIVMHQPQDVHIIQPYIVYNVYDMHPTQLNIVEQHATGFLNSFVLL